MFQAIPSTTTNIRFILDFYTQDLLDDVFQGDYSNNLVVRIALNLVNIKKLKQKWED